MRHTAVFNRKNRSAENKVGNSQFDRNQIDRFFRSLSVKQCISGELHNKRTLPGFKPVGDFGFSTVWIICHACGKLHIVRIKFQLISIVIGKYREITEAFAEFYLRVKREFQYVCNGKRFSTRAVDSKSCVILISRENGRILKTREI